MSVKNTQRPPSNRNLIFVKQKEEQKAAVSRLSSNQSQERSSTGLRLSEPSTCERRAIYEQGPFPTPQYTRPNLQTNKKQLNTLISENDTINQSQIQTIFLNKAETTKDQARTDNVSTMQKPNRLLDKPIIEIRPRHILSINTSEGTLSKIVSNNNIVSQSVKHIPRGGKLVEGGKGLSVPLESPLMQYYDPYKQPSMKLLKKPESMVISEPDAEEDIDLITAKLLKQSKHSDDYETMISQRKVNSLLQQSEVEMREELSVQNVRPINSRPKIQHLIKQALQSNHKLPMTTGKRQIKSSGQRRPQTRETLSSGSGSMIYPSNRDAMLIGNYSKNHDSGAFMDSLQECAYIGLKNNQDTNQIKKNFVFTGRNVPKQKVKSFKTLTYSANMPTIPPAQSQFYVKRGRNNLFNKFSSKQKLDGSISSDRSNSKSKSSKNRKQFVKVSGRKIDPCTISHHQAKSRASLHSGGQRLCHCSGGGSHTNSAASLTTKKQQVLLDSKDQSYFQQLITQSQKLQQEFQEDLDHQSQESPQVNHESWFQYGLAGEESKQELESDAFDQKVIPTSSTVYQDQRNSMQSDGTILGPNQSPNLLQSFMLLRETTQISTSNQSASLENSMKLAPKLQTDDQDNKLSQKKHSPKQKKQSDSKTKKQSSNRSSQKMLLKQSMPIGDIAIFHTYEGLNFSSSNQDQADTCALDMLNRSLVQQTHERKSMTNSKSDRHVSIRSNEGSKGAKNVDGSIFIVANKFAKEIGIKKTDEIESQAPWLAQASLSVAIVKKQLQTCDDQNVQVSKEARRKYLQYLKRVIQDAEDEL